MRILIVGAGIAGLAARRALVRRGFTVKVIERNPSAGLGGAGLFLPGNGVRALCDLGLQEGLFRLSYPVNAQRFYDERGRLLTAVDTNAYWRGVAPCRAIRRSDLWHLLNDGMDPGDIEFRQIVDLVSSADGCHVAFADGGMDAFDLVIGADGMLGRAMTAEEGAAWGFFNALHSPEQIGEAAHALAAQLAAGPTFAHGVTKKLLHQEWNMGVDEAIEAEAEAQAICMQTRDFHRAYEAFVAKQKPVFEGN